MYEFYEKTLIKIINSKKETKETAFNNFLNEIKLINISANGEEDKLFNINGSQLKYVREVEKQFEMNLMNYILKSKNELIYDHVMQNYKEKIEFKNANSYYSFLIELLNQKKAEDFFYFIQFESVFSQKHISARDINKQLTKKTSFCFSSSINHVYNQLILQSLLLDTPDVYNYLIDNGMYSEKESAQETYQIKKWFINHEILMRTPSFILRNMEYFKSQKDNEIYSLTFELVKKYNDHYQSPLNHFIIKNMGKTSTIVKDFKTIIDMEYHEYTIESYFKNNILHYIGDSSFTDKEYETIGKILKKYSEQSSRPDHTLHIFADFFFRHNYDVASSIDYTKHVPYRFKTNQKLYEIITQSMTLKDKQDTPKFFLNGIFDNKVYYSHATDKRDLLENIPTIETILKEHSLSISKPEDLFEINSVLLANQKIDVNLYKYVNEDIYSKLHKQNKEIENKTLKNNPNQYDIKQYFNTSCFYAANTKSMENSILKLDKDNFSILRELAIIKIHTRDEHYYSLESQRIDTKIDVFLNKTNIIPKEEFNHFIMNMKQIVKNPSDDIELSFSTLFEKMHIKNALKNIEIDDTPIQKKRI